MRITSETLLNAPAAPIALPFKNGGGQVFSLQAGNDRINGSIPAWGSPKTARDEIQQALSGQTTSEPISALALNEQSPAAKDESFGFFDLIDMINPLQHIPVVGTIYRALTGDEIKPIAQIVGGAVFGGPLGAASGVANAIVQEETGKDIGDTLLGMVTGTPPSAPDASNTTLAVTNLSYRQPQYNE